MKAIRKLRPGPGNMACVEVTEPKADAGMVKVKIAYCGICGSDMKFFHWTMRPGMNIPTPITFGHELSGVVCEIGSGVTGIAPGDRVVSETANVICGRCEYCISGNYLLCRQKRSIGYQVDGAMAEYIAVRQELVHKIPQGVSLITAALSEPACVAMRAVYDHARVLPGDWVVIFGPGVIGQMTAQLAKQCGARIILVGRPTDRGRLALAQTLGADAVLTADRENLPADIARLTDGRGADWAFECSGSPAALDQAMRALRRQGTLVVAALFQAGAQPLETLNSLVNYEITLQGSYGQRFHNWDRALRLMQSGQLNLRPLATHIFPLEEYDAAFAACQRLEGIKVLLHPQNGPED